MSSAVLPKFFPRLGKACLWILLIIFLLVLLALGLLWFLAGTDRGFDWALSQATKRVDGLEITQPQGNLNSGIAASDVSYKNEAFDIQLTGVDTDWRTSCLIKRTFCFDRMEIDSVRVTGLAAPSATPAKARTDKLELPDITIPLDVNIEDVWIKEFVFQPYGDGPEQVLTELRLKAENIGNTVNIEHLSAAYKNFTVSADGDITLKDDYPLNLNIDATATDLVEEHDFQVQLTASNSLDNVEFNANIAGAASAQISGRVNALEPTLPLSVQLTSKQIGWPLDTYAQAKATNLDVAVDGDLNDFNLTFQTDVSGEQIPASSIFARGVANPSRVLLPELTVQTLGGFATGNLAASLGEQTSWVSEMIIKDINPETLLPDIQGKLNGIIRANGGVHDGKWMLNLSQGELDGEVRGIPFDLNAQLSKSYEELWDIKTLVLNNGDNRIDAKGQYGRTLDFNANINLTQLHNFVPGLAGGFSGVVDLSGTAQSPNVAIDAEATVLKYEELLITGLKLDANVEGGAKSPSTLNLTVDGLQQGTQLVQNTSLALNGTLVEHVIKFFADGPEATAIDLTAGGALSDSFDWLGEMQAVELELPAHKVSLAKPFELGWNNDIKKARIDAHCWKTEETRLCLKNEVLAEPTGTATIALTRYPLARLDPFLPASSELQGKLQAEAFVNWGEEFPGGYKADFSAKINQGGIKVIDDAFDELTFNYDTFGLEGSATGEKLAAAIELKSNSLGNALANVTVDPTQESKPIDGDLELNGFDISFLKAFLPEFEKIGGTVSTKGKISGSLSDPRFNGKVELNRPIAQAETLPLQLDGGQVVFDVDGKRAKISGNLISGNGIVKLSGDADWTQLNAWKANVLLDIGNVNLQYDPLVESTVNTSMRVALTPGNIKITGDVDVPMARIEVAESEQGATSLSSDVVIIEDEEEQAALEEQAASSSDTQVEIDLNVDLGDDVTIEAFGLKATLDGDMSVSVKPPRPLQLGGEVRIVEGIYKQYGQDLTVTDGQVLFVGPVDNTRLSMDAVRDISGEERMAGLRVSGALKDPEVTLFTEPADKSQDSILSYVLLGRDINETSDAEQNLLASAALALTLKGGRGRATKLAESLGVEDFSLDARGQGDETEVVVSGRLNDRLLIRYGRSVFTAGNTLYLRYDLSKQLYLEAAQGIARAVDVFYSFSF